MIPVNFATKEVYKGKNIDILLSAGFTSPYWLGFVQAKNLGGYVKAGQHGTKIMKCKPQEIRDDTTGTIKGERWMRKTLTVFNAEQIEGINFDA